ncbi:MAG: hypothetical protein ABW061_05690 [Polyangiaceae bacterium]
MSLSTSFRKFTVGAALAGMALASCQLVGCGDSMNDGSGGNGSGAKAGAASGGKAGANGHAGEIEASAGAAGDDEHGGAPSGGTSGSSGSSGSSGMPSGGKSGAAGASGGGAAGSSGAGGSHAGNAGVGGSSGNAGAHTGGAAGAAAAGASGGGGISGAAGSGGGTATCGNNVKEAGELCDPKFTVNDCGSDCKTITSAECFACENSVNTCLDFVDCSQISGNAGAGTPAAGVPKANLCNEVLDCVRDSGCAAGNGIIKCYCGTAGTNDCQNGLANGVCKTQIERGLETLTFAQIAQRIKNPQYGGGIAGARIDCDQQACKTECNL